MFWRNPSFNSMIRELTWDSFFFKRKIGALQADGKSLSQIKSSLNQAEREGFQYIICKTGFSSADLIRFLESSGFYLTDIGITWALQTDDARFARRRRFASQDTIEVATLKDVPMLQKISKGLFVTSRFYHDPFFSRREADNLYQKWVENSVKNFPASSVFHIPGSGFIVCKKSNERAGEIVLVGVKKGLHGKGIGSALIEHAMRRFRTQGIETVTVRTQLRNLKAMNFYAKLGFHIREFDIVLAKMLGISHL